MMDHYILVLPKLEYIFERRREMLSYKLIGLAALVNQIRLFPIFLLPRFLLGQGAGGGNL